MILCVCVCVCVWTDVAVCTVCVSLLVPDVIAVLPGTDVLLHWN